MAKKGVLQGGMALFGISRLKTGHMQMSHKDISSIETCTRKGIANIYL